MFMKEIQCFVINFSFTVGTKLNFPEIAKCLIDETETMDQVIPLPKVFLCSGGYSNS